MVKKSRRRRKKSLSTHASWRGALSFGLVTFPVETVNAIAPRQGDIHFHQIHAKCHNL